MEDIENLKKLQVCFVKTSDILNELIELMEKLEKEQDKEKCKEIEKQIDDKEDDFLLQMIKISKFEK